MPIITDAELTISTTNLLPGYSTETVYGLNSDIDTGTPEDIWEGGGAYTGFPTGTPETIEFRSSSPSDTGTLTITGLKNSTDRHYTTEDVSITGTTWNSTTDTWYRVHRADFDGGSGTTLNQGIITVRHTTTIANVFVAMQIGKGRSSMAGLTVPQGRDGYIMDLHCTLRASGYLSAGVWCREEGKSPKIILPFELGRDARYSDRIYGGEKISPGSDVIVTALVASAFNINASAKMTVLLVSQ